MALKDWERRDNQPRYITWRRRDDRVGNYNVFYLVVKPVENANKGWIVFISAGDAGTSIIYRASNKESALKSAKKYMESH